MEAPRSKALLPIRMLTSAIGILAVTAAVASAQTPTGEPVDEGENVYVCPAHMVTVYYDEYDGLNMSGEITAGLTVGDAIAIVRWPGEIWVMVRVASTYGRLYARGPYRWWDRGSVATFFDSADPANLGVTCTLDVTP